MTHILYGPRGTIAKLMCKVCGAVIASEVPTDFGPVLTRNDNYAEVKIACEDRSFHVTNGCRNCLNMQMPPKVLNKLIKMDLPEGRKRKAVKVVAYDESKRGIV